LNKKFKIPILLVSAFFLRLLTFSFDSLAYFHVDLFIIALLVLVLCQKIEFWHVFLALLYGIFIDMMSLHGWGLTSLILIATLGVLKFFEKNFTLHSFISVFVFGLFLFSFFILLRSSADIIFYGQIDLLSSVQLIVSLVINSTLFAAVTLLYGEKPQKVY